MINTTYWRRLISFLTDDEMLLSLYDNTRRIYEWHIHEINPDYTGELASEQLEEARQSKVTAISLGKVSSLAFIYLPLNFVYAMLGMNLSIYGQGESTCMGISHIGSTFQSPDIHTHLSTSN